MRTVVSFVSIKFMNDIYQGMSCFVICSILVQSVNSRMACLQAIMQCESYSDIPAKLSWNCCDACVFCFHVLDSP